MKTIDFLVQELPKCGGWPKGAAKSISYNHVPGVHFWDCDGFRVDCSDLTTRELGCEEVTREQYEAALAAKNEDWIEWGGGECPVPKGALVDVRYRNSEKFPDTFGTIALAVGGYGATGRHWNHDGYPNDIIAYRLHQPQEVAQTEAEQEADLNECIGQVPETEWNGEGLPPVGVKCEFTHGPYSVEAGELTGVIPKVGEVVEVVAHRLTSDNNPVAVVYWDDNGAGRSACFVEDCFRPLRLEADRKRDESLRVIYEILDAGTSTKQDAADIYDAIAAGKIPGVKLED